MSTSGPTSESQLEWITEEEWANTIDNKSQLPIDGLRSQPDVSIFRVPDCLMKESLNGEAYIPQRVSLGPYHHRSAKLRSMDSHKGRALNRMMMRYNTRRSFTNDPINMEFSVRAKEEISKLENEIKKRYQEIISCNGETLSLMLSLDGCFILEILRTLSGEFKGSPEASNCYEPIFERATIDYTGNDILDDILKLENQIPLTVLKKLLELELNQANVNEKVSEVLVKGLWDKIYPFTYENANKNFLQEGAQAVHHILGFYHKLIVSPHLHNGEQEGAQEGICLKVQRFCFRGALSHPTAPIPCTAPILRQVQNRRTSILHKFIVSPHFHIGDCCRVAVSGEEYNNGRQCNIHRAVELINAGIKFKSFTKGIKRINFDPDSATIYLPHIIITDTTEVLFRNLIAFEMCKPSEPNYVACYVYLMDQLIDSEEDVALLRRKGIVTNGLGSDGEVAKLFNGLCKGITASLADVFGGLTKKVNDHYKSEYKVQCAQFVRDHFSSVWKAFAWAAAIFIVVLTVVQTVFSILQVYK